MSRRFPSLLAAALVGALLLSVAGPAATGEQPKNRAQAVRELKNLQDSIARIKARLEKNRSLQSETETALRKAETAIGEAAAGLRQTRDRIGHERKRLKDLQQQRQQTRTHVNVQQKALAGQLKSAYISGRQEYLKLLLNQEDPASIGRNLIYYDYLNRARTRAIEQLREDLATLMTLEKDIQTSLTELTDLESAQRQQEKQLRQANEERRASLNRLKAEYINRSVHLEKMQDDQTALQDLIEALQKALTAARSAQVLGGLSELKNKLNWPLKGSLLHRYGSTRVANRLRWNGILISAPEGREVQAVHHGQVVFSDWLRGYGLVTILDHGKGFISLYGYNQALLKSVGDFVEAGEPVATSGRSGGRGESGLYFEIRRQGKPQNPLAWLE